MTTGMMSGHQPHWMPGAEYFAKVLLSEHFVVSDDVKFVRHDWMNRNRIRTPEGWQWITATTLGAEDEPVFQKRLDEKAVAKAVKSIEMTYRGCRYWEAVKDVLGMSFREKLADACWEQLEWFCGKLGDRKSVV